MSGVINRRTLLRSIGAGSVTLTFAGLASADGETRYLVRTGDEGAERRLRRREFAVEHRLADGAVLVVTGPDDAVDELEGIAGVSSAAPDFAFELEAPELSEPARVDPDSGNGNANENSNGPGDSNGSGSETEDGADDEPALFDGQWDKRVTEARSAHERATGEGRRLAIVDTGVDHTHQDLGNVNEDESVTIFDGEVTPHTGDVHYHGTHVAGIAAATGAVGVLGTAPDAEIVSVRVFAVEDGDLVAYFGDILLAMAYAAAVDADAANASIGTAPIPPQGNAEQYRRIMEPVVQSVTAAGTLLVGSAGNDDANLQQGGRFTLPNSLAGVTSVSATGPNDERTFYSNYGTNEIDVGAPGGGYETAAKTGSEDENEVERPYPTNLVLSTVPGDGYDWLAGTSMAAPQVTGTAALVRERRPDAPANRVERAIAAGADLVDGGGDPDLGAGRLNANDALDGV
ncbi:S8 family peptidase [Natrinema salifodinae]|uniref:Serine protease, subtilisin family n=1 Tax=Natrinema salifodinae TaxID=1202768 RepID=A0A1I0PHG3_9EURY|nr:S8 family serine peptidase [Natrinema salifodinae]SEW13690.1 Serine protease, subtilisin family [Natrinema salifodinae]